VSLQDEIGQACYECLENECEADLRACESEPDCRSQITGGQECLRENWPALQEGALLLCSQSDDLAAQTSNLVGCAVYGQCALLCYEEGAGGAGGGSGGAGAPSGGGTGGATPTTPGGGTTLGGGTGGTIEPVDATFLAEKFGDECYQCLEDPCQQELAACALNTSCPDDYSSLQTCIPDNSVLDTAGVVAACDDYATQTATLELVRCTMNNECVDSCLVVESSVGGAGGTAGAGGLAAIGGVGGIEGVGGIGGLATAGTAGTGVTQLSGDSGIIPTDGGSFVHDWDQSGVIGFWWMNTDDSGSTMIAAEPDPTGYGDFGSAAGHFCFSGIALGHNDVDHGVIWGAQVGFSVCTFPDLMMTLLPSELQSAAAPDQGFAAQDCPTLLTAVSSVTFTVSGDFGGEMHVIFADQRAGGDASPYEAISMEGTYTIYALNASVPDTWTGPTAGMVGAPETVTGVVFEVVSQTLDTSYDFCISNVSINN
jgi:hypothetical protein